MNKRRASFWTFLASLVIYPVSLFNTFGAIARAGAAHGTGGISDVEQIWWRGRVLAGLTAALLLASIVLGFVAPPERGRRLWWVLPATVLLIVIVYFDFLQIGFS